LVRANAEGKCGCLHGRVFSSFSTGTAFSGTTASAALTAVGSGHVIIADYCVSAASLTVTITDGTNTYTAPAGAVIVGTTFRCGTTFAPNVASGNPTITATASGTVAQINVWVTEWSGIVTTSALDGTGSGAATAGSGTVGQTFNSGNWTTSSNGDLIYGFSQSNGGSLAGAGFTTAVSDTSTGYGSAFATQGSAGSINAPFATIGSTFAQNLAVGLALKQTGGAAGCPHTLTLMGVGC
jgi:hypothetical protein